MEYTDGSVKYKIEKIVGGSPTGSITAYAGDTVPYGWLLCDGSAVSRADYSALFSAIGTKYGAGDGSTTFNLPNLTGRFVEGGTASGETKSAGLPNITGDTRGNNWIGYNGERWSGAMQEKGQEYIQTYDSQNTDTSKDADRFVGIHFDASKSNAIYGASDTVQPPAIVMQYIIKT